MCTRRWECRPRSWGGLASKQYNGQLRAKAIKLHHKEELTFVITLVEAGGGSMCRLLGVYIHVRLEPSCKFFTQIRGQYAPVVNTLEGLLCGEVSAEGLQQQQRSCYPIDNVVKLSEVEVAGAHNNSCSMPLNVSGTRHPWVVPKPYCAYIRQMLLLSGCRHC